MSDDSGKCLLYCKLVNQPTQVSNRYLWYDILMGHRCLPASGFFWGTAVSAAPLPLGTLAVALLLGGLKGPWMELTRHVMDVKVSKFYPTSGSNNVIHAFFQLSFCTNTLHYTLHSRYFFANRLFWALPEIL
jgi:hypothetical protein